MRSVGKGNSGSAISTYLLVYQIKVQEKLKVFIFKKLIKKVAAKYYKQVRTGSLLKFIKVF